MIEFKWQSITVLLYSRECDSKRVPEFNKAQRGSSAKGRQLIEKPSKRGKNSSIEGRYRQIDQPVTNGIVKTSNKQTNKHKQMAREVFSRQNLSFNIDHYTRAKAHTVVIVIQLNVHR
jgi:hypothetical protein